MHARKPVPGRDILHFVVSKWILRHKIVPTCCLQQKQLTWGVEVFYSAMKAQNASDNINVGRRFKKGAVIRKMFDKSSRSTPAVQPARFSPDRITSCRCPTKAFCSQSLALTTPSTSLRGLARAIGLTRNSPTLLQQGIETGATNPSPNSSRVTGTGRIR